MNERQHEIFGVIVQECESEQYSAANIASQGRRDAVRAAWYELKWLRTLLLDAVTLFEYDDECNDPSKDAWRWLQDAQKTLESVVVE